MEIRGVWLTNTDSKVLRSKKNIAEAMKFLAETGFNMVFPVVWNKAQTLYPSQVMGETFGVEIDPLYQGRDPLAELIEEASRYNLAVIPWFEYGFASSYNLGGGHLLAKKPEWAARDYAGNLLKKNNFEWMNALDPQVQDFMLSLVLEVVKNYEISGIHGDDRLPAFPCEGGYDPGTIERYYQTFHQNPPQNPKDPQWVQWRADILTNFLARLYQEVKAIKPDILVSMAPNIYKWCLNEYLQDSKAWLEQELADLIHPQVYRRDFYSYKDIIDRLLREQFTVDQLSKVSPGILIKVGSYRITPEYLVQAINYNRSVGIKGEILFFYEGLREDNDALAKALREGPYAKPASELSIPAQQSLAGMNMSSAPSFQTRLSSNFQRLVTLIQNRFNSNG
ncbi:family 10 glycosylhydrolase [Microcoleus sp. FACHB-68]|uniref:glycoside hydrolase family 10 protein n=1 Tax=Microcoleus sp. FACHB-68 TaxID=2692826 RepID=UPI0016875E18|nr:family 10 glycosylhydrolase [Microcoleus sp. FACHB-68]MBD1935997.1 family 10 glycosylhydrolase [Microcoleus sp. FACHB-68]